MSWVEKNPAKQKETEESQPEAENKREEQSSTPISARYTFDSGALCFFMTFRLLSV